MTSRWDTPAPIRYPDADIVSLDPRFASIALGHAAIARIATDCRFTEGPVWFGDTRQLLFSDIPNERILRWDEETGAVSVFRRPRATRPPANIPTRHTANRSRSTASAHCSPISQPSPEMSSNSANTVSTSCWPRQVQLRAFDLLGVALAA